MAIDAKCLVKRYGAGEGKVIADHYYLSLLGIGSTTPTEVDGICEVRAEEYDKKMLGIYTICLRTKPF